MANGRLSNLPTLQPCDRVDRGIRLLSYVPSCPRLDIFVTEFFIDSRGIYLEAGVPRQNRYPVVKYLPCLLGKDSPLYSIAEGLNLSHTPASPPFDQINTINCDSLLSHIPYF